MVSGQLHAPATSPLGKDISIHWLKGWVGPRAGLDKEKITSLLL